MHGQFHVFPVHRDITQHQTKPLPALCVLLAIVVVTLHWILCHVLSGRIVRHDQLNVFRVLMGFIQMERLSQAAWLV